MNIFDLLDFDFLHPATGVGSNVQQPSAEQINAAIIKRAGLTDPLTSRVPVSVRIYTGSDGITTAIIPAYASGKGYFAGLSGGSPQQMEVTYDQNALKETRKHVYKANNSGTPQAVLAVPIIHFKYEGTKIPHYIMVDAKGKIFMTVSPTMGY